MRSAAGTRRVVVRPVTAAGYPAAGYRVVDEDFGVGFGCASGPSPVAVSRNIRFCGDSATDTVACWRSAVRSSVLCLRNPVSQTLARITYTGSFAAIAAPTHAVPQALERTGGTSCLIRDGGAWQSVPGHPSWVGWYYCPDASDVYGPRSGNGIDRSASRWTVRTVMFHPAGRPTIRVHKVKTAYYVGTA